MIFVFKFPDIGEGIHEGKILEWHVSRGQTVKEGDPLVKVETDKVVADIPVPRPGMVRHLFGKVGQVINVGDALAELETESETAEAEATLANAPKEAVEEVGYGVVGEIEVAKTDAFLPATGEGFEDNGGHSRVSERRRVMASPVARKMASDLGVDLRTVKGTGPAGRVMKEDVRQTAQGGGGNGRTKVRPAPVAESEPGTPAVVTPPTGPKARVEYEELSQIRKTIAARMAQSKFTAPHLTAHEEVEVSRLVELRNERKDALAADGITLSYVPFIVRAVALSLREHRKLNCRLDLEHNRVIYQNFYNVGIAVDTPDGLIVPVIKDADQRSVLDIARIIADFAVRARQRQLNLNEIREGTFSITNYGSIAGTYGVPIINFPEVAILGVGRIMAQPVVKDGAVVPGHVLPLSLSADHRIVDGGDVARFLRDLMLLLRDPVSMLLK
jgi:pyruvate dehydrogenase E2 component (dihydrolipoamide acetyltransferase)